MDNLVKIELMGQPYTIRTSADKEQVLAAAALVRERLEEYRSATRSSIKLNVAILTALDLANDYLQLQESHARLGRVVETRSKDIIKTIEEQVE